MATSNPKFGKEYYQRYFQEHKKEIFTKLGECCAICGSTQSLEIDHVNEEIKKFAVLSRWSMKDKDALMAELEKCQLLCVDCHKEKTRQYLSKIKQTDRSLKHGTIAQYYRYKCRCGSCRAAYSVYKKEQRRKAGDN